MKQPTLQREYQKLFKERERAEVSLRHFVVQKMQDIATFRDLASLARLKLKGGSKDISARFKAYLYTRK